MLFSACGNDSSAIAKCLSGWLAVLPVLGVRFLSALVQWCTLVLLCFLVRVPWAILLYNFSVDTLAYDRFIPLKRSRWQPSPTNFLLGKTFGLVMAIIRDTIHV